MAWRPSSSSVRESFENEANTILYELSKQCLGVLFCPNITLKSTKFKIFEDCFTLIFQVLILWRFFSRILSHVVELIDFFSHYLKVQPFFSSGKKVQIYCLEINVLWREFHLRKWIHQYFLLRLIHCSRQL